MARYGVIFALVFQSLLLLCCSGRLAAAPQAIAASQICAAQPSMHEGACCCEGDEDSSSTVAFGTANIGAAQFPSRCCECPLTVEAPRLPAVPDRRPVIELTRVQIAIDSAISLVLPDRSSLLSASVPASIHPPDFAGRLACERFCRWTI